MAESQIADLQNARVLLEDARGQLETLSEHRHARVDVPIRVRVEGDRRPVAGPLGVGWDLAVCSL